MVSSNYEFIFVFYAGTSTHNNWLSWLSFGPFARSEKLTKCDRIWTMHL